eukprot:gene21085-27324_t
MKSFNELKNKLVRQQNEFNQLELDLQTRLDDKEFKATEINESFKKFKREILLKAVNSRTGHNISNRVIKHIEISELKHEEDLEKIRLKNISLRTTLKKLERNLRAKEQLAEGLHMIDFEQLKIENQTLNEKIEENTVTEYKQKRDATRLENKELKLQQGFVNSNMLIADYEDRKYTLDQMKLSIEEYKDHYKLLVKQIEDINKLHKLPYSSVSKVLKK